MSSWFELSWEGMGLKPLEVNDSKHLSLFLCCNVLAAEKLLASLNISA